MSQQKVNDTVNMIFNFTHKYPDLHETLQFIREHGTELTVAGKDSGRMNARSLEALLDVRLLTHTSGIRPHQDIRQALLNVELERCRDKPADLFRTASLFKLAAEQGMRWRLEKNPELAMEYVKDPINFIKNYELDAGEKAFFKEVLKINEDYAREKGLEFNPALAMHAASFAFINGPILKHLDERSQDQSLSEKERARAKAAYDQLSRGPARLLTDSNTVISGAYKSKFQSITNTRYRDKVVNEQQIKDYLEVLDEKLVQVDPDRGIGAIVNHRSIRENVKDFGQQREQWRLENRTDTQKARDSFVGFFKKVWQAIKSVFTRDEEQTFEVNTDTQFQMQDNPLFTEKEQLHGTMPDVAKTEGDIELRGTELPAPSNKAVNDMTQQQQATNLPNPEEIKAKEPKKQTPDGPDNSNVALPEEQTPKGPRAA